MSEKLNSTDEAVEALMSGENISEDTDIMGSEEKRKLLRRGQSLLRMVGLGAPDVIKKHLQESFESAATELDYSAAREDLENLPEWAKERQNQLFNILINGEHSDGAGAEYIKAIAPAKRQYISAKSRLLRAIFGEPVNPGEFDYVDSLTEKDAEGNYVISNETFNTFVEWYHSQAAQFEKELAEEAGKQEGDFVRGIDRAVERGFLPESFAKNAERLDKNSPNYEKPRYLLADYSSPSRIKFAGNCGGSLWGYGLNRIHLKLDDGQQFSSMILNSHVAFHEDMHYISGNGILFGKNRRAHRIINEAITETATMATMCVVDEDEDDYEFGDGKTYKEERKVLKYLQSGGEVEIDPKVFFEAYAEKNESIMHAYENGSDFEKWWNNKSDFQSYMSMGELEPETIDGELYDYICEKQLYGPKIKALYSALYQAFPECKTPEDLGEMIVGLL